MKKDLWVYMIILIIAGVVSSCQIINQELGQDLLPSDDNVLLFHDTIFDIRAYPVTATEMVTSEVAFDPGRLMLLGNLQDTIVGSSVASIITQFNTNGGIKSGPNFEIDSMLLSLKIDDYLGDVSEEITFRIYEFTERLYRDSTYYANYNPEGKYNAIPLAELSVSPEENAIIEFLIEDIEYKNKFMALSDTTLTKNDSLFKDSFQGFYLTAESASPEGVMAKVLLADNASRLSMKYSSDSTQVDSIAGKEYVWGHFGIDPYFAQKVNLFMHDFSETHLGGIINHDSVNSSYCYVQGMAGVNTRFSFENLAEWMAKTPISISSATLIFDVVPEEESGILYEDLPGQLMIKTILEDGSTEDIYDYYVLNALQKPEEFGGRKKAVSQGLFYDTTYTYRFKVGLHFQSMIDGSKPDNDFILQLDDAKNNPRISKLWGNLDTPQNRIRLEVAYLKL